MPKLRWWCGLFFAGLVLLAAPFSVAWATPAQTPLVLSDGQSAVPVVGGVEYLIEEPGAPLTREQVQAPERAARWQAYEGRHVNLVLQRKPVWFRFDLHNQSSHSEWLLNLNSPLLEDVLFQQSGPVAQTWLPAQRSGTEVPASQKLFKHTEPAFQLSVAPGQTTQVLLRVHTESSFVMPMTVWAPQAFEAQRFDTAVAMGVLFGILAVMLLYNASLFAFTRDRSYFVYSLYLLFIVLYELSVTGIGPLYLWPGVGWAINLGYELFGALSFLLATVFFRQFLDLKTSPAVHVRKVNTAFIVYWAFTVACVLVLRNELVFYGAGLVGMLSGAFAIYSSVVLIVMGVRAARYFAIAWLALVVGTAFTLSASYGAIENSWLGVNGQHIGFVIETVLLSLALADRIKREREARERAQQEALKLTLAVQRERDQKIKAQAEVIEIQSHAKAELEQRVADRTAEVEQAMCNLEVANVELARLSVTDALTRVHNRRYFDEVLEREHERSARAGVPLALLLADIDHFKVINDRFGHLTGDECLRLVAAALQQVVGRSTDLIARYGGEEFALVLPGTSAEQAVEVAERVRLAVQGVAFCHRDTPVPLSVSVGVCAQVIRPGQTVEDFIAQADAALYLAKEAGRNRVMLAG